MQWLYRVGIAILAILVVLVAISFLLPRQIGVERSIVIAAPPATVYGYVGDLREMNRWSPWAERDPDMQVSYSPDSSSVGARMSWISDHPQVGSGSQEIIAADPPRLVRTALDFGSQGTAEAWFTLLPAATGTEVTWSFTTDLGLNPVARYMGLFFDGWVGADYEWGLARLKALVERENPAGPPPAA